MVMLGAFISPTFAQQFKEPNYDIRGGTVLGFEIDQETTSLIITLDARARGELTITLPRNLIDAKTDFEDSDFSIFVSGLKLNSFDETMTSSDRTVTIPFKRANSEIIITGTQVFSPVTTVPTLQQKIDKMIVEELRSEIPGGNAKLLIFSDTTWSGLFSTLGEQTQISGQGDKSIVFRCESSLIRGGLFAVQIQKTVEDGYLKIVAIQNQKIMSQKSTEAQFGEVIIKGSCVSSFETGPGGGGGCLIATATFGSELAPQVQQLRELRDKHLLQTESGTSFMSTFNDFYYSFSPVIADYERENPVFKEAVKIVITPMISSLSILNYVEMDSEESVLGYGISLILLNVGMYFVAPAIVIVGIRKRF